MRLRSAALPPRICPTGIDPSRVIRLILDGTVARVRLDRKATSIARQSKVGVFKIEAHDLIPAARDCAAARRNQIECLSHAMPRRDTALSGSLGNVRDPLLHYFD